ncbi:MAG: hypothetical protein AAFZ87_10695, partial [Planctomycetota bacterium]
MTVGVDIQLPGLVDLLSRLDDFRDDQVPFALSVAMNRAAKDAVGRMRAELGSVFDLRSRSLARTFGPSGRMGDVTRGWSSKRQWPNLFVDLHSLAPSMALQEEGGTKPFRARAVWIPTSFVPRQANGRKPRRYQPGRIRDRLGRSQRGDARVFERDGIVYERRRSTGRTVPLYLVRPRARVDPALGFEGLVRRTFDAKIGPRFEQ